MHWIVDTFQYDQHAIECLLQFFGTCSTVTESETNEQIEFEFIREDGDEALTSASLWVTIDIWLFAALVSADRRPTVICGRAVSDILAERDVYRPESHAIVPIAEYFGNKTNTNDRMCLAEKEREIRYCKSKSTMERLRFLLVERSIEQPIQWSKYNSPNPSRTHRCGTCTIRSNCQTVRLLCHAIPAAPAMPSLPNESDLDSPANEKWSWVTMINVDRWRGKYLNYSRASLAGLMSSRKWTISVLEKNAANCSGNYTTIERCAYA